MGPLGAIEAQRGHLFPWAPVCLALGIGLYFALRVEPPVWAFGLAAVAGLACLAVAWRGPARASPVFVAAALVAAGLCLAGARSHMVAAPVLDHRVYGAVEGRVLILDRSQSDAPRLTLDEVWMERRAPEDTPARIRLSLYGTAGVTAPLPGARIAAMAALSPPAGPAEPGGFDFRRHAWFAELGAVGYTRSPAVAVAPPEDGIALAIHRSRVRLAAALRARLPGDEGAFAAAILTGDRSAIARETLEDLRAANLAHLLAISGLHMGLLTGVVFATLRFVFALVPWVALHLPVKKGAALGALAAGAVYLALSGGNVATERAFIMVAVVFGAVLADRRALTLRAVAVAALIVLLLAPESLTQAGFQMSFAATTALVAAFGALRDLPEGLHRPPRWAQAPLAVLLSSAVAGLATAPFGAAHFNQVAQYGLLANLLTVPLMGSLVMPAAVLAACLAPFGLAGLALEPMRWGIAWILAVAEHVAGMESAVWTVPAPGPAVLPLLAFGALFLMLWQGRARLAGLVPAMIALLLWAQTDRPELLIAESGGLMGVMGPEGRALSKPRGEGFTARNWLENDGDRAGQAAAFARPGISGPRGAQRVDLGGTRITLVTDRGWEGRIPTACAQGWVVVPQPVTVSPEGCTLIDRRSLSRTGALAIRPGEAGLQVTGARILAGRRPWAQ